MVWYNINYTLCKKKRSQNLNDITASEPESIASTFNSYYNDIISNQPIEFQHRAKKYMCAHCLLPPSNLIDRYSNFTTQKNTFTKLNKLRQGTVAYNVNNSQHLLNNFLTGGYIDSHYQ